MVLPIEIFNIIVSYSGNKESYYLSILNKDISIHFKNKGFIKFLTYDNTEKVLSIYRKHLSSLLQIHIEFYFTDIHWFIPYWSKIMSISKIRSNIDCKYIQKNTEILILDIETPKININLKKFPNLKEIKCYLYKPNNYKEIIDSGIKLI